MAKYHTFRLEKLGKDLHLRRVVQDRTWVSAERDEQQVTPCRASPATHHTPLPYHTLSYPPHYSITYTSISITSLMSCVLFTYKLTRFPSPDACPYSTTKYCTYFIVRDTYLWLLRLLQCLLNNLNNRTQHATIRVSEANIQLQLHSMLINLQAHNLDIRPFKTTITAFVCQKSHYVHPSKIFMRLIKLILTAIPNLRNGSQ